jgi:hypothetical protein
VFEGSLYGTHLVIASLTNMPLSPPPHTFPTQLPPARGSAYTIPTFSRSCISAITTARLASGREKRVRCEPRAMCYVLCVVSSPPTPPPLPTTSPQLLSARPRCSPMADRSSRSAPPSPTPS